MSRGTICRGACDQLLPRLISGKVLVEGLPLPEE